MNLPGARRNLKHLPQPLMHHRMFMTCLVSGYQLPSSSSAAPSNFQATPEQLAQLQQLLSSAMGSGAGTSGLPGMSIEQTHLDRSSNNTYPEMSLSDILTPANITPLFTSHPSLIPTLFPHLPPDLPMPPSPEVVQRIIRYADAYSPQL